jgi:uncharacterized membrane protein
MPLNGIKPRSYGVSPGAVLLFPAVVGMAKESAMVALAMIAMVLASKSVTVASDRVAGADVISRPLQNPDMG